MAPKNLTDKWRFAIGTTSRVPDSGGKLHYFMADFDEPDFFAQMDVSQAWEYTLCNNLIIQKTKHGWHIYTDRKMPFDELVELLVKVRADPAWVRIGKERGYFFLADKSVVVFPWPVEHMVIYHGKKEA